MEYFKALVDPTVGSRLGSEIGYAHFPKPATPTLERESGAPAYAERMSWQQTLRCVQAFLRL